MSGECTKNGRARINQRAIALKNTEILILKKVDFTCIGGYDFTNKQRELVNFVLVDESR